MPKPNDIADFWRQVNKTSDCWNWVGTKPSGRYGRFKFKGEKFAAHRFSWLIHHGEIPSGAHVLHHCDNPACVNPSHLYLGDHKQNMSDKVARGRCNAACGEGNGFSKLTEHDVRRIRARYSEGARQVDLARDFNVYQTTISKIVTRKQWSHI